MQLIPWRKNDGLSTLRNEFDELWNRMAQTFDGDFTNRLPEGLRGGKVPAVDVAESEDRVLISVEMPGLEEKDFQLEVMGDQLVVSGERKWKDEKKTKEYHRLESQYGRFRRMITLPPGLRLEPESIKASYKKGILEVEIPKLEPTRAAKIPIRVG
jgi:HSP20 family protein